MPGSITYWFLCSLFFFQWDMGERIHLDMLRLPQDIEVEALGVLSFRDALCLVFLVETEGCWGEAREGMPHPRRHRSSSPFR